MWPGDQATITARWALSLTVVVALLGSPGGRAQETPAPGGLHHVHLNVLDPERSVAFYTNAFEHTTKTTVAGWDAVQSENIYLLFNKVEKQAPFEWDNAIWHVGWNSPDVEADTRRLIEKGVIFFRVPPPTAHIMTPDLNDVEISLAGPSSGGTHPSSFNHVHLMSEAPLCAAEWYEKMLGLKRTPGRGAPDGDCNVPYGPRAIRPRPGGGMMPDPANMIHSPNARLFVDDIAILIYPNQRLAALSPRPVDTKKPLVSTRGHVYDHIAVTYPDVPAALQRLRKLRVKVLEDVHNFGNTQLKAAMIEGPDGLAIELIERAARPSSLR
jgi:catechol 2,3-dioxygenase-like lactoylglutathione lyase family enzyme